MLCPFARGFIKSSTTRVRTFLKPRAYLLPVSRCGRALKPLLRELSKRSIFGERIHWFRVDERPNSCKIIRGFKNIRMRWKVALFRSYHLWSKTHRFCFVYKLGCKSVSCTGFWIKKKYINILLVGDLVDLIDDTCRLVARP